MPQEYQPAPRTDEIEEPRMGKALDPVRAITSLSRAPIDRAGDQGVTINEIEDKVREFYPQFSLDDVRTTSLLFAILKQGCSIQKLHSFTSYNFDFIRKRVEWLRSSGLLFTGTLSTQYVLEQVPGSEDLVGRITGQKFGNNRKEKTKMSAEVNAAADANAVTPEQDMVFCSKSAKCRKRDGHTGRCSGQGGSVTGRIKKAKTLKTAPKAKASKRKPAPALKATAVSAEAVGHYKIEYEDETRQFNFEGIGREAFLADLDAARMSVNGGSNG